MSMVMGITNSHSKLLTSLFSTHKFFIIKELYCWVKTSIDFLFCSSSIFLFSMSSLSLWCILVSLVEPLLFIFPIFKNIFSKEVYETPKFYIYSDSLFSWSCLKNFWKFLISLRGSKIHISSPLSDSSEAPLMEFLTKTKILSVSTCLNFFIIVNSYPSPY